MKTILRDFDETIGALTGRLPKYFYRPFEVLCLIVRPSSWALAVMLLTLFNYANGEKAWVWAGVAILALLPLSTVAKLVARRQRPVSIYTESMKIKSYSFPSSHAYSSMLAGGFVGIFLLSLGGAAAFVFAPLILLVIVLVGIARVFLGAHFPSDVLGGFLLAIVILWLVNISFDLVG